MFMHKIHKHICSWSVGGFTSHIPPGLGSDLSLNQGAGKYLDQLYSFVTTLSPSHIASPINI